MNDIEVKTSPFSGEVAGAVRIEAPEFTHKSETPYPHMANLKIEYVPRELVLEGESLGLYFQTFRDATLTPEEAVNAVCADLSKVCEPMMLTVQSNYAPRGAIAVNPQARYMHPTANQPQNRIQVPH